MVWNVSCSECGKQHRVGEDKAGRKFRCRDCGTAIRVPESDDVSGEDDAFADDSYGGDDEYEDQPIPPPRRSGRGRTSARGRASKTRGGARKEDAQGTLTEMCQQGQMLWVKMAGAGVATPLVVYAAMRRAARRGGEMPVDPAVLILILVGSSAVGAVLGAALTVKDVVRDRLDRGAPVAFPLKLLFGMGFVSLLVWMPLAIVVTCVVSMVTLL